MSQSYFDLDAPIIPRTSAAGFSLGQRLEEMSHLLSTAKIEKVGPGFNAVQASEENEGLLYIEYDHGSSSLEYRGGIVQIGFTNKGELSSIWLFEGYQGLVLDAIKIGHSMNEVKKLMPIFYDDGDEMFYPNWEIKPDLPYGISFIAVEEEEADSEWKLQGISIHDYDRFCPKISAKT
jgi:hypothetical protein